MSRGSIIVLSVFCCVFGVLALSGPEELRAAAYGINVVLALVAFALAGRDLNERGWRLGYLLAATYVLPLIGTLVYIFLSNRPKQLAAPAS